MGEYSETMKGFDRGPETDESTKRMCWHSGCPLAAAARSQNGYECVFHYGSQFSSAITDAINRNIKLINKYCEMVHWTNGQWARNRSAMVNWNMFPMDENEMLSMYLNRFHAFIDQKIQNEASQAIEKPSEGLSWG